MKKKLLLAAFLIVLCIISPVTVISSATDTISLWATAVLPALLPFFILTQLLSAYGGIEILSRMLAPVMKFFGFSPEYAFPFSMSLACGYPSGSRICASMQKDGYLKNAESAAILCHSSGPVFITGTLACALLNMPEAGIRILVVHICSVIITGIIFSKQETPSTKTRKSSSRQSFADAINSSLAAVISICGYMVFFGIICTFLQAYVFPFLPVTDSIKALLCGIFEMTAGLKLVCETESPLKLELCCFLLSFSGLCIIFQSLSYLTFINKVKFIFSRLICGVIAFILCELCTQTWQPVLMLIIICTARHLIIIKRRKTYA